MTGSGLVNELIEAKDRRVLNQVLRTYTDYQLLILDDLRFVPFSEEGGELLCQVLAERYERGSVIITTILELGDWTQVFGDPDRTAALLDRLTHRAHIIRCTWPSYRMKENFRASVVH